MPVSRRGRATLTTMATITATAAAIGTNAVIRRGRVTGPAVCSGEVLFKGLRLNGLCRGLISVADTVFQIARQVVGH